MIRDTNALSASADNDPDAGKRISDAQRSAKPVITIGEYRYGIARSRFGDRYQPWLDTFLDTSPILDVTNETSCHYAATHRELSLVGRPIPVNDRWITTLCRQHNFPLLSRDSQFDQAAT